METSEAKVFTHVGKDYETGTTASGTVTPKASARDVYSTLILGADAYGVTEITGGGLQHIVKQLGSAGTADPWTSAPPQAGKPPRWPSAWWRRTWSVSRPAPPSTANHRGRLLLRRAAPHSDQQEVFTLWLPKEAAANEQQATPRRRGGGHHRQGQGGSCCHCGRGPGQKPRRPWRRQKRPPPPRPSRTTFVPIRLFKDNDKYKDDVFVAVNGRSFQIKRGETVQVPAYVAEVLEQSMAQDNATANLIERESSAYAAEAKARNI